MVKVTGIFLILILLFILILTFSERIEIEITIKIKNHRKRAIFDLRDGEQLVRKRRAYGFGAEACSFSQLRSGLDGGTKLKGPPSALPPVRASRIVSGSRQPCASTWPSANATDLNWL